MTHSQAKIAVGLAQIKRIPTEHSGEEGSVTVRKRKETFTVRNPKQLLFGCDVRR